jgi:hypothetical protein
MDYREPLKALFAVLPEQIPELVVGADTVLISGERHAYFGVRALKELS